METTENATPRSKMEFVKSLPLSTSVDEVLRLAAEAGIATLSRKYLYNIRGMMKAEAGKSASPAAPDATPQTEAPKAVAKPKRAAPAKSAAPAKRAASPKETKAAAPATKGPAKAAATAWGITTNEELFARRALVLGIDRARVLLDLAAERIGGLIAEVKFSD